MEVLGPPSVGILHICNLLTLLQIKNITHLVKKFHLPELFHVTSCYWISDVKTGTATVGGQGILTTHLSGMFLKAIRKTYNSLSQTLFRSKSFPALASLNSLSVTSTALTVKKCV